MKTEPNDFLTAARLLTEWTGDITEAQVKTLNLWPAVMIPGLKSHTVTVNLKEHKVVFKLIFKAKKSLKDFNILTKLETGVWSLLGDTWLTVVKADRRIIYVGSRRKEFANVRDSLGKGREGFDPDRARSVPEVPGSGKAPAGG